jgi:HAD superfamily hydrolase (TIGR01450 family)
MEMKKKLVNKKYLLLDCDGVVWRGNQPIINASLSLDQLEEMGYRIGFVTNNSSLSRQGFRRKFSSLGFNATNYTIINSAYGAAIHLKERGFYRIFIIGEKGLRRELELLDFYGTEIYESNLQAVCIGWDRKLTWIKLAHAMRVILEDDGYFLGTNPDNSYPLEEGRLVPGAGAGIAALAASCDKEPDIIIGKPNRFLIDLALREMDCTNPNEVVYVGDRLSTDILAGINAGIDTILVKTGISEDHLKKEIYPNLEIDSIADIEKVLE